MKKIINWTVGSFFRTIGRTLAFILFGILLAILFNKLDLKIPFLTYAKAFTLDGSYISSSTYSSASCMGTSTTNCSQFINSGSEINLADSQNFLKYYFIYSNDNQFYILTATDPFYVVITPHGLYDDTITAYSTRFAISEEVFNQMLAQNQAGHVVHDPRDNKYYYIDNGEVEVHKYAINGSTWTTTTNTTFNRIYAQNIDNAYHWGNNYHVELKYLCNILYENVKSYEVNFHLNGGTASINYHPGYAIFNNDFKKSFINAAELNNFIISLDITNDVSTFNNWYYDKELLTPYSSNNSLNSNINLYASYEYTSVDSIISNITFTEYTFPDNYEYAIISVKENFTQGLYLGLTFNFQYLDVYNYVIADQAFTEGSLMTLTSMGSYNYKYYYHVGMLDDNTSKVIVLDKASLITLNAFNEIVHHYVFYVSDNCYVYFTNDLTQVSYYIPTGNGNSTLLENKDISANYEYSQQLFLDNNSDLVSIYNGVMKEKNTEVFRPFINFWEMVRSTNIFPYFMGLIVSSLIILIVKAGSRH